MKHRSLCAGLCALIVSGSGPGYAQAAPVISGPPDVVVVVYQQPGGADQVGITYAHTIPRAQAVQDLTTLAQQTGWPLGAVNVKDAAAPVHSRFGPMTAIEFQSPGVIQDSAHTFPIEMFARAFRKYKRLNALFFAGPQFQFQGSRSYADNDIKMTLNQHGTTYAYTVEIDDPNFARLPLRQTRADMQTGTRHKSPWGILLGILGAAAVAGLLVYLITSRLTQTPALQSGPDTPEAEARREVETRR